MTRKTIRVSKKEHEFYRYCFFLALSLSKKQLFVTRSHNSQAQISRNPCSQQFEQQLDNSGGDGRGLAGKSQRRQLLARLFARSISYDFGNDPL